MGEERVNRHALNLRVMTFKKTSLKSLSRISANYRLLFPLMWLGVSAFFVVRGLMQGEGPMDLVGLGIAEILIFVLVAILLKFLMKIMPGRFVEEVYDCGDFLLIRHRGEEDRVPLSNIADVLDWTSMFPPGVTLHLNNPGKFGALVKFTPRTPFRLSPYAEYANVKDLISRIHSAKSKRML